MGLVGHERRASQRALYESSIISGVRIDDYSKMRMGLTVGYTGLIKECALLIGEVTPSRKIKSIITMPAECAMTCTGIILSVPGPQY